MLSRSHVAAGFTVAWHVLVGRPRPLEGLDVSFDGFWRSFAAPFLVLPLYLLHIAAERRIILDNLPEGARIEEGIFVLSRGFAFLLDVAAFPLLVALLAGIIGVGRNYVPLVVIFNWTAPLVAVPLALPSILLGAGMLDPLGATFLLLGALTLTVFWRFRAARAALGNASALAGGVVALDFLLSLVLGEAISRVAGV